MTKPLDLASSVMSAVGIPKPSFVDVTSGTQNVNYSQLLKNFVRDTSGKDQSTKYDTIASNQVLTEKKKVIDQEVEDLLNPKKDK